MNSIGERIKARRKELHMSQDDLAFAIGANRVTVSCYETGKYAPSAQAVFTLAKALGVTTEYLMGEESTSISPDELISFALFGDPKETITDEEFEDIKRYAQFLKEKRSRKK